MSKFRKQIVLRKSAKTEVRERIVRSSRAILTLAVLAWGGGIGTGMYFLWGYSHAPGLKQTPPELWPAESQITDSRDSPVLLLFAHPKCPCTRATIRELERLSAMVQGQVEVFVVFTQPPGLEDKWSRTDLNPSAAAIDGIHIFTDRNGTETNLFCARTSGLALLYSASGRLLFEGGITSSRGHEGDNDGIFALESLILKNESAICQTPVYGCPLQSPEPIEKRNLQ